MVGSGLGMFLEMKFLDLLPAGHDASAAADADVTPHLVEITVVDCADVFGLARERGEIVAAELMIVVGHGIGEAANNGFGDIWEIG